LKLPILLAQFLYQQKQLNIPGVGVFSYDGQIPDEKLQLSGTILFKNDPRTVTQPELIEFIRVHTGKMRPLAEADLDAFSSEVLEFLNIGKPCIIDGIGTLSKGRDGQVSFSQGQAVTAVLEQVDTQLREKAVSVTEDEYYKETKASSTARSLVLFIALLIGIGLVGWGGYYFYQQYQAKQSLASGAISNQNQEVGSSDPSLSTNSSQTDQPSGVGDIDSSVVSNLNPNLPSSSENTDSIANGLTNNNNPVSSSNASNTISPNSASGSGVYRNWKFVIRTASYPAAKKRYDQLKGYGIDVYLDVRDSSKTQVYFKLSAPVSDTLRIKDSLKIYYASPVSIYSMQ
jgi:type II secretory pathway pseudopilin PulG